MTENEILDSVARALEDAMHADANTHNDTDLAASLGWMTKERFCVIAQAVLDTAGVDVPRHAENPPPVPDRRSEALDEIGRLATGCWMDMRNRLQDDEDRRAHDVLRRIAVISAIALSEQGKE